MIFNVVILALVTIQRLGELLVSKRNTKRLIDQGAREHAAAHYPLIVALHTAWLASLWWLGVTRPIDPFWLAVFILIEIGRAWVFAALGERWTTRIIVVPGETLVRTGPYRFLNHPNYAVVAAEIAVLPLVFGLWRIALVFSLLNAVVLAVRIHEENRALGR
jgi:methyltransferase